MERVVQVAQLGTAHGSHKLFVALGNKPEGHRSHKPVVELRT
jgi:hypothetical protein